MKYMTFNSSCSYTGLANMLSCFGIDTDDRTIALQMGLPYFFAYEDGAFLAGPSLQTAKWFNLYLNPLGFELDERPILNKEIPDYLRSQTTAMLGIRTGRAGKHAVVFTGMDADCFHFLNNKWADEPTPETLTFPESDLIALVDDPCIVATLRPIPPRAVSVEEHLQTSLLSLEQYRRELHHVCNESRPIAELRSLLNPLFRALLLDGITMLQLLNEDQLAASLSEVQHTLLKALRSDALQLCLSEHLPMDTLDASITKYQNLIRNKLK